MCYYIQITYIEWLPCDITHLTLGNRWSVKIYFPKYLKLLSLANYLPSNSSNTMPKYLKCFRGILQQTDALNKNMRFVFLLESKKTNIEYFQKCK